MSQLKEFSVVSAIRIAGAAALFLLNLLIATRLGAENSGVFFLLFAFVTLISIFCRFGFDNLLLRDVSPAFSRQDFTTANSIASASIVYPLKAHIIVGLVIFALSSCLIFFDLIELLPLEILSALLFAVGNSFSLLAGNALRSVDKIALASFISGLSFPFIALLILLFGSSLDSVWAIYFVLFLASSFTSILGYIVVFKKLNSRPEISGLWNFRIFDVSSFSFRLWNVALVNRAILPWLPVVILFLFSSSQEAGIFGAAGRIGIINAFLLAVIIAIAGPKFSRNYSAQNYDKNRKLLVQWSSLTILANIPLCVALIYLAPFIASFLGTDFKGSENVIVALAIANSFVTLAGVSLCFLNMTKGENRALAILLFTVLIQFAAFLIFKDNLSALLASRIVLLSTIMLTLLLIIAAIMHLAKHRTKSETE